MVIVHSGKILLLCAKLFTTKVKNSLGGKLLKSIARKGMALIVATAIYKDCQI